MLSIGKIQNWVDMGRIQVPKDRFVTIKDLVDAGLVKLNKVKFGIKLLGDVSY